jgi:hypothetical protein
MCTLIPCHYWLEVFQGGCASLLTRSRIQLHPSVDFIIVINPASGPGPGRLPDSSYVREIVRLNSYANVRTLGYVPMSYGRRPIQGPYNDIATYINWGNQDPRLSMQGIFLDESPQIADDHNSTYVERIREYIKAQRALSGGLLGMSLPVFPTSRSTSLFNLYISLLMPEYDLINLRNHPVVGTKLTRPVMNPGMIPDGQIMQSADKTVVFEERYQTYINLQAAKQLAALPDRNALVCLMHSIPADISNAHLRAIVNELRMLAGSIFLTDLSEYYYSQFSPRFEDFVNAMI